MKKYYSIFLFAYISFFSQTTINSTLLETNWGGDSEPDHLTLVGEKLLFSANVSLFYDGNGRELWIKDNPNSKSRIVKDINSGGSSIDTDSFFIDFNGVLLFTARSSNNSYKQLWRSDGTSNGTYLIKTINSSYDTNIRNATILNGKLYFSTYINNSSEIWVTDGTTDGTYQIKKINSSGNSNVDNIFIYRNQIFFTANDGVHGTELWKTDGTEGGTVMVKDFFSGSSNGIVNKPIVFNDKLIFYGKQSNSLSGLWSFNVDNNEATLIQNLQVTYNPIFFAANYNGSVYAVIGGGTGYGNLWKTNGTANGTIKVSNGDISDKVSLENFVIFKNKIYLNINNNFFETNVWRFNEQDQGMKLSSEIPDLSNAVMKKKSSEGNYLLFQTGDSSYFTDGTLTGTKKLNDVTLITNYTGYNYNLLDYDNKLLMNAKTAYYGVELYNYDFYNNKTTLFEDLNHLGNSINYFTTETLNGKLIYFGTDNTNGFEVFTSDGTIDGTYALKNVNMGGDTAYNGDNNKFFKNNDKIYYRCTDGAGYEPCVTDGTKEGTKILKNISNYNESLNFDPYYMRLDNQRVLFAALNPVTFSRSNLWISDGTEGGTKHLSEINVESPNYAKVNNEIFYSTYNNLVNNTYTYSIAKTDGTSSGTKLFKTIYNEANVNVFPNVIGSVNNRLIYVYRYSNYWGTSAYSKLMSSDGNNPNTDITLTNISEISIEPIYQNEYSTKYVGVYKDKLYFYAKLVGDNLFKLYSTDGTIEGTKLFSNLLNNYSSSNLEFTICDDKLFIKNGNKIFITTDGRNLEEILNSPNSNFGSLKCLNKNIFFASKEYQNNKIWISNGTSMGTRPLSIYVNGISAEGTSYLNDIATTDSKLFFSSSFSEIPNIRNSGQELYVADLSNLNLGLNEINFVNNDKNPLFKIYPNPVVDSFKIMNYNNAKIHSVTLYDLNGKRLKEWLGKTISDVFDVHNLDSGVYMILVKSLDGRIELIKAIKK